MDGKKEEAPLFVLAEPTEFWWDVRIPAPAAEGGEYRFAVLQLLFAPVDQDELDWMQGLKQRTEPDGDGGTRIVPQPTDDDICQRVLRGWRRFNDAAGNPVPFRPDTLARLLRVPMARQAIAVTYLAVMRGMARKNA